MITIEIEYNNIVKQNDVGDIFTIQWTEGAPKEFTFNNNTVCYFIAKHKTKGTVIKRQGTVDPAKKSGTYALVLGDTTVIGTYEFEFEFVNAGSTIQYRQSYPKSGVVTFQIVKELG